jgi:oxygen-independent coproporphyrinogen-3 oxidase
MQTRENFHESLEMAVDLGVKHISCYSLKVEEDTPLAGMLKKGVLKEVGEETDREMYEDAKAILSKNGYMQYEISNFAKPGYECKHNIGYWELDEYIGLGTAAHSYFDGRRFSNVQDPGEYIRSINKYEIPEEHSETIDENESMKEFIILGLRMTKGINTSKFKKMYNRNIYSVYGCEIRECVAEGLLETENGKIRLTKAGMDLANRVFVRFI